MREVNSCVIIFARTYCRTISNIAVIISMAVDAKRTNRPSTIGGIVVYNVWGVMGPPRKLRQPS